MVQFEGKLFSPALQEHAEKQLRKFNDDARVFLTKEGDNIKAQIVSGELVATSVDKDGYKAISDASKKIIASARKKREMINDKKGKVSFGKTIAEEEYQDVD